MEISEDWDAGGIPDDDGDRGFNIEYDAIGNINSNRKLGVNAFASLRGAPTTSNW